MALPLEPQTQDEMFPDTYVPPFSLSEEVADAAAEVIEHWDEFRGLRDALESEAHPLAVAYVLDTKKFDPAEDDWTIHTVVNATKASPLWRVLSGYDVVVAYRPAFWDAHEPDERLGFLHHGLSHIDALGGKVAIRPHPVEGFPWTFRRYGPLSLNDRMFLRAGSLWTEDHPSEPTPLRSLTEALSGEAGQEAMTKAAAETWGDAATVDRTEDGTLRVTVDSDTAKTGRKPRGSAQAAARPATPVDDRIGELKCNGGNHVPGHTSGCPRFGQS